MGLYADKILPVLIDWSMRNSRLRSYRERVVGAAVGRVLEVGVGSGHNLPFYPASVSQVLGLDPSASLLARARERARQTPIALEVILGSAEAIPLDSHSVDTIVMTWTGCSIPRIEIALSELMRVLKADGRMLFVEHGLAADYDVALWQNRLTPIWRRVSGGCHLNRKVDTLIEAAGFDIEELETGYMEGPRPLTYMYRGIARPVRGL